MRQGKLLLTRRSPHRAAYPATWSFPGGHVEEAETNEQALVRELEEEIGISATAYTFLTSIADPNSGKQAPIEYLLYSVTDWTDGEPRLIGDEHTELAWFTPSEAAKIETLALRREYRALFAAIGEQASG